MVHHLSDTPFQVHLSYSFVLSESSAERGARISHPRFTGTIQGENQSIGSIILHDIREILLFAFAFSVLLLLTIPMNVPLLTATPTSSAPQLGIFSS